MHKWESTKFQINSCDTSEGFSSESEIFTAKFSSHNISMEKMAEMKVQVSKFIEEKVKEIFGWE